MTPRARFVAIALALLACGCGPADDALLARTWAGYRSRFIAPDGRVVRPEHGNDTVSEGQAYAMLRAAWMDDQATFDRVWHWTKERLNREGLSAPALLAWRWTLEAGVADTNVAADADADVALALLVGAGRWPRSADIYRSAARAMLTDLIEHLVGPDEQGRSMFLPGEWADERREGRGLVLNPSYLAPASFRVFHRATGDGRWLALADGAYDVLEAVCDESALTFPPDWIRWWSDERWTAESRGADSTGWDAVRVPWRIGTDWLWFKHPRARAYLDRCIQPLVKRRLEAAQGMPLAESAQTEHPLANAMFSFALESAADRDRLLARLLPAIEMDGSRAYFAEPNRYYVNSLAYLPFLARAGRYKAP